MTRAITKNLKRPSWMTPFGHEGLGDVFSDRLWPEFPLYTREEWDPTVNVHEKEGKFYITAEIPGLKKEDISVSYDNRCVTIRGKEDFEKTEESAEHSMNEMRNGAFFKSFKMPGAIDEEKIEATYKDGVLTLILPHIEKLKGNKIKIH
jgi:HSP20 family protein